MESLNPSDFEVMEPTKVEPRKKPVKANVKQTAAPKGKKRVSTPGLGMVTLTAPLIH